MLRMAQCVPVACLACLGAAVLSAGCGSHPHRPNLPPPEYEEPAQPTPAPSPGVTDAGANRP